MALGGKTKPLSGTAKVLFCETTRAKQRYKTFMLLLDGIPEGEQEGKTKYQDSRLPALYFSNEEPQVSVGDTVALQEFRIKENPYWVQAKAPTNLVKSNPHDAVARVSEQIWTAHKQLTDPTAKSKPQHTHELVIYKLGKVNADAAAKPVQAAVNAPAAAAAPISVTVPERATVGVAADRRSDWDPFRDDGGEPFPF
jgi:hypothetical protein